MEIKHTNGYPVYSRLKQETKDRIEKRWVVPTNEPYLYIDKYERPFVQRPNDSITLCTIKKETLIALRIGFSLSDRWFIKRKYN